MKGCSGSMTVKLGRGQSGGHITLFFTISDEAKKIEEQGSLGAGLCLKDGVEVIARGEEGTYNLKINYLNGNGDDELYIEVINLLMIDIPEIKNYRWELNIKFSLPLSQGFGMSGAGALAAASSIQRALGISHEESRRRSYLIAHRVERIRSTGLGDITALSAGGVERRIIAGSPYNGIALESGPGKAEGWFQEIPIILAWKSDTGRHTSNYIDNMEWKRMINFSGKEEMYVIGNGEWDNTRWPDLINSAEKFVMNSKLIMDSKRDDLLSECNQIIEECGLEENSIPLLCMLGQSIVIVPKNIHLIKNNEHKISDGLRKKGFQTIITSLSPNS